MMTVIVSTLVCLALGAIPVVAIGALYLKELNFRRGAQKVSGAVVALQPASSYSSGYTTTVYCPVIEFQTRDGQAGIYTGKMGSARPRWKVGQQVELYCDPRNPEVVHMGSFWADSPWMTVLAIMAGVFMVIGLVFYIIIVFNSL